MCDSPVCGGQNLCALTISAHVTSSVCVLGVSPAFECESRCVNVLCI